MKHGYPLSQHSIEYAAEDAYYRGLANTIIITGGKTGGVTKVNDISRVKKLFRKFFLLSVGE